MANPYLDPARVRAALRALGVRPTREMGQNFLVDAAALAAIVAAAELTPADTVVEVGPGLGVLTWELLQHAGRVVAVELDRRLAGRLHDELGGAATLRIVQGDVLQLPPAELLDRAPGGGSPAYKVVANLPYAITSAALRHFLTSAARPELLVVLVQREVAERITARPGDLSVLAHSVQLYAEPEIVAHVPAESFVPPPEVESAVLRLRVRPHPALAEEAAEELLRLIKAGFLHARKKLSNALPSGLAALGMPTEKQHVLAALESAGVSPDRRAETVTLEEWAAVAARLRQGPRTES